MSHINMTDGIGVDAHNSGTTLGSPHGAVLHWSYNMQQEATQDQPGQLFRERSVAGRTQSAGHKPGPVPQGESHASKSQPF